MNSAIIYATKHGFTKECSEYLRTELDGSVELIDISEKHNIELKKYDKLVIGTSVYAGNINKKMKSFLYENEEAISKKDYILFLCSGSMDERYWFENFPDAIVKNAKGKFHFGSGLKKSSLSILEKVLLMMIGKYREYKNLKEEVKFLSKMTQYNFLLMAQRLFVIRDRELYKEDGYKDFKEFIEVEINVTRQTVYKYIDIYSFFSDGVALVRHDSEKLDYSKLLPYIPLLKANEDKISKEKKEEIKKESIEKMKIFSKAEMIEEAKRLKIEYGIINEKEKNNNMKKIYEYVKLKIPESITNDDKKVLKELINFLNEKLN